VVLKKKIVVLTFIIIFGYLSFALQCAIAPITGDSFLGSLILSLGRDLTFTDRTFIWSDIFDVSSKHSIFGVGYGGFWIGELANIPFSHGLTWTLGQAHNGFVDAHLQLGWAGIIIIAIMILWTYKNTTNAMVFNEQNSSFRFALLSIIMLTNVTESTLIRAFHNQWLLFLSISIILPDNNQKANEGLLNSSRI